MAGNYNVLEFPSTNSLPNISCLDSQGKYFFQGAILHSWKRAPSSPYLIFLPGKENQNKSELSFQFFRLKA